MKDKPSSLGDIFGAVMQNLGDAIIQSVDDVLLASRGPAELAIPDLDEDAAAWASAEGIELIHGAAIARAPEQPNLARAYQGYDEGPAGAQRNHNACVDFARTLERVPAFVLRPVDETQLATCARWLGEREMPWVTRGSGLSTGGQTLIGDGCVVRLDALDTIEDLDDGAVTVGAGVTFAQLVDALGPERHLPVTPRFLGGTIAGCLAVGSGIGDTSHQAGHLARHVTAMRLMLASGELRDVAPGDDLFRAAIGGFGQVAVIVSVTLPTHARPNALVGARATWESVGDFVDDAISLIEDEPGFDYLAATRHWLGEFPVIGDLAVYQVHGGIEMASLADFNAEFSEVSRVDASDFAAARWKHLPRDMCRPSLEALLPYPGGLEALRQVDAILDGAKLGIALPRGAMIAVLPTDGLDATNVPMPDAHWAIYIGLRPMIRQHRIRGALRALDDARQAILEAGGRVNPGSTLPLDKPLELDRWLGAERHAFLREQRVEHAAALLNPGMLD